MGILNLFKRKTVRERIIEKFYSDYPEIPYISDDREAEWIDKASLFNNMPVKKSMMQRFPEVFFPVTSICCTGSESTQTSERPHILSTSTELTSKKKNSS